MNKPAANNKTRFSNRVADYIASRPGYPSEVVAYLESHAGFSPTHTLIDLGSGTGLSSIPFLQAGYRVIGVEPNADMRHAADELLAEFDQFSSVGTSAEATGLAEASADIAIAGQAFHWFNRTAVSAEMQRVLKPNGPRTVALLFNDRRTDSTEFLRAYEALLRSLPGDYAAINHKNVHSQDQAAMREFFASEITERLFYNEQRFDLTGFISRVCSSSYVPSRTDAEYPKLLADITALFERYQTNGEVVWEYDCRVIWGRV